MQIEDKKDLQGRLQKFSLGDEEYYQVTRLEARYLGELINKDWRSTERKIYGCRNCFRHFGSQEKLDEHREDGKDFPDGCPP